MLLSQITNMITKAVLPLFSNIFKHYRGGARITLWKNSKTGMSKLRTYKHRRK